MRVKVIDRTKASVQVRYVTGLLITVPSNKSVATRWCKIHRKKWILKIQGLVGCYALSTSKYLSKLHRNLCKSLPSRRDMAVGTSNFTESLLNNLVTCNWIAACSPRTCPLPSHFHVALLCSCKALRSVLSTNEHGTFTLFEVIIKFAIPSEHKYVYLKKISNSAINTAKSKQNIITGT